MTRKRSTERQVDSFMEKPGRTPLMAQKYTRTGHPSIEELVAEQGTRFPADPVELLGDFCAAA